MDTSSLWNAGSSINFSDPESAYVIPGESIITCKNFDDLILRVQNWFKPNPLLPASNTEIFASLTRYESSKPERIQGDLNPCLVVTSFLYDLNSDAIARIVGRVGLRVNWELTDEEAYSEKTRLRALRPRIEAALLALEEADSMLVARNIAHELICNSPEKAEPLHEALGRVGWQLADGELTTANFNIREAFFPSGAEHTAYIQIRSILGAATRCIDIIDPYLDSSVLTMLKTLLPGRRHVRLLTAKLPPDFKLEATKLQNETPEIALEIRTTREFHDRFIVLDDIKCFHIGASIKDLGRKACMISQLEDRAIAAALIEFAKEKWKQATLI